ncbi:antibiotic biosynthesis monooxygenase [Streptomyces sp. TS71-3]|uniref:antibiotic biosynthesis monooxygenase n=1 Tax=Streptomyces sp. TS71-3 TaxID=2733862 RepID=UPI001B07AF15|nr:antibiotic biosynthesis monooxygenase [Streptomyces sp. TS71-3]GHJ38385.1 antibiotic biosynthesis monooxygenase [Streptomyces sp. TS71-3]
MTLRTDTFPDPARPDVGLALFSTWHVGTPERQEATVAAIAGAWQSRPWPHAGLLSYTVYAGTDGATLLHHSQWRDEESHAAFVAGTRNGRDQRNADIDRAVPGIERQGLARTRRYRGGGISGGDGGGRLPGVVVIVDVRFDGPDPERQRAWVDAVFDALASAPVPPGGISGHFHLATDGTRVVNYAEWESEQAHIDALAAPGDGIGPATPEWRRVQNFPGVTGSTVRRYRLAASFAPDDAEGRA